MEFLFLLKFYHMTTMPTEVVKLNDGSTAWLKLMD